VHGRITHPLFLADTLERAALAAAVMRAGGGLAARQGDAAGGDGLARVGAVDVARVGGVLGELAQAPLLRLEVGAARRRGRRPGQHRRRAHRQLPRVARSRRRRLRSQHQHHQQRHRLLLLLRHVLLFIVDRSSWIYGVYLWCPHRTE